MKCLDHENAVGLQRLAAKIDRRERQACSPGLVDIRDSREVRREVREHDVCPDTLQLRCAEVFLHHLYASDGGNLQQINGDDAPAGLDPGGGHLRPAARRGAQVHYDYPRPQKLLLVVYLEKLERRAGADLKSTRLNSSHRCISYAVFCLKKKKQ